MDFKEIADKYGNVENPYAGKMGNEWLIGFINAEFLNRNFGQYTTATEMKNATSSEGLQLFFDDLVAQGKLKA